MVVELVKGIKPKKLRVDQIRLNLLNALRAEGRVIEKEFEKTTATWEGEKPGFESLIGLSRTEARVVVGPTGSKLAVSKWVWADEGTKPHKIRASKKPNLVFRTSFSPKTRPNVIDSFPGSSSPPWRKTKSVNHPGTRPRNFSLTVLKRRRKIFARNMIKAARII